MINWLFYVAYAIFLLLLGVSLYLFRVKKINLKKRELENHINNLTDQLQKVKKELEELNIVAGVTDNTVVIADSEGNFEWVNESFTELSGFTLEQLVSESGENFLTASTNPHAKECIRKCISDKSRVTYESIFKKRDGNEIWTRIIITPVLDDEGNIKKLVALYSDISKIRETEKKLSEQEDQLAEAKLKMEKMVTLDGLTGIANFRRFEKFFYEEWKRAERAARPISVILIDVDLFKMFNETYGFQTGDECLKKVAKILKESVNRPTDLVARYGGEEFVMVLAETDSNGALTIAEKVRKKVEELKMVHEKSDISNYITISIGCATTIPTQGIDPSSLINAADNALYNSKRNGRNQTTTVAPSYLI